MRTARWAMVCLAFVVGGCPAAVDETGASLGDDGGQSTGVAGSPGTAGSVSSAGTGSSSEVPVDGGYVLQCEHGGMVGKIHVQFDCDELTVYSCKDISNVVLEFADGSRQRYENGYDQVERFAGSAGNAGKTLIGVWVKAGNNKSGDGPGYGERFDAPDDTCDAADGGIAGSGGAGGAGGTGEAGSGGSDGCADTDPDTVCNEGGQPPDLAFCQSHPNDPSCSPE